MLRVGVTLVQEDAHSQLRYSWFKEPCDSLDTSSFSLPIHPSLSSHPIPLITVPIKIDIPRFGPHMGVSWVIWGIPKIVGLYGKILLKWMISGYPYFRKPPSWHTLAQAAQAPGTIAPGYARAACPVHALSGRAQPRRNWTQTWESSPKKTKRLYKRPQNATKSAPTVREVGGKKNYSN